MQDNTSVNINVANLCGVDYKSNVLQLGQNATQVGKLMLSIPAGAPGLALPSTVLNRGVYTVYIYSGRGDDVRGPSTDLDDFVVGQVQINGNQQVMPINYGAF
jgi:hypothetical protein